MAKEGFAMSPASAQTRQVDLARGVAAEFLTKEALVYLKLLDDRGGCSNSLVEFFQNVVVN